MTEAFVALAYFTVMTLILTIAALVIDSLPPSESDYKEKEMEFMEWTSKRP